jgi:hypothetical protein
MRGKHFTMLTFVSLALVAGSLVHAAGNKHFSAELTAAQDGPRPVLTSGSGSAEFTENPDGTVAYKVVVQNVADIYMAHLHLAVEDKYGPMVVWLYPPHHKEKASPVPGAVNGTLCEGTIGDADLIGGLQGKTNADLVAAMEGGKMYLNVHTTRYRSGELRGRIH